MDDQAVTEKLARHRGPPERPRIAGWIYWTTLAAVILIGAVVALAMWLGPSPEVRDATDPPIPCSSRSSEGDPSCPPPAAADAIGRGLARPIARPVTSTFRPSPTSIATVPAPVAARPPRPSPSGTAPRFSELPTDPTGPPGSEPPSTPVLETTPTRESPSPDVPDPTEEATMPAEDPAPTSPDPTPSLIGDLIDDVAGEGT